MKQWTQIDQKSTKTEPGAVLGRSGDPLGAKRAPKTPKWAKIMKNVSQNGGQIDPKSMKKVIQDSEVFYISFWIDFGWIWELEWRQKWTPKWKTSYRKPSSNRKNENMTNDTPSIVLEGFSCFRGQQHLEKIKKQRSQDGHRNLCDLSMIF